MEELIIKFIRPELLILIPVLWAIGTAVKTSKIPDNRIPLILGGVGIFFAVIYTLATAPLSGWRVVLLAIFVAITQGILCAGAAVYGNQIVKQQLEKKIEDFNFGDTEGKGENTAPAESKGDDTNASDNN